MNRDLAPVAYRLTGVRRRYGGRVVLDVPALDIRRGETLGIIGPSGAGKSTLLRLLQFLESPSEGTLEFDGMPAGPGIPVETLRRVSTVFQRPVMLTRTVRDNVMFGRRLRGRADTTDLAALLDRLDLTPLASAPARTLSGGEAQRVALARSIASDAEVLLLDEPAANLDPGHVTRVEAIIREQQARGRTIVLVTHNTHEARRLATRTLFLLGGQMVECGPTAGLFDAPADPRTRAFLAGELVY